MLDQSGVNSGSVPALNKVSFKAATIVSITAKDVDPEFAVKGGRGPFAVACDFFFRTFSLLISRFSKRIFLCLKSFMNV